MQTSKVIIINGPSCSGKTSLIHAIRQLSPVLFLHYGIDLQWNYLLPKEYICWGSKSYDGFRLVPTTHNGLECHIGQNGWNVIYGSIDAINALGRRNNVLVDEVIVTDEHLMAYINEINNQTYFIGLQCQFEILEQRAKKRTQQTEETTSLTEFRPNGLVENHINMHKNRIYDLMLDSSITSVEELAIMVLQHIQLKSAMAFQQMKFWQEKLQSATRVSLIK